MRPQPPGVYGKSTGSGRGNRCAHAARCRYRESPECRQRRQPADKGRVGRGAAMTASLFFLAFGLSVAYSLLPGAVAIETLRRGTVGGFCAAVRVRVGALLGSLAWAGLALSGAGLVLQRSPAQLVVGALGAA